MEYGRPEAHQWQWVSARSKMPCGLRGCPIQRLTKGWSPLLTTDHLHMPVTSDPSSKLQNVSRNHSVSTARPGKPGRCPMRAFHAGADQFAEIRISESWEPKSFAKIGPAPYGGEGGASRKICGWTLTGFVRSGSLVHGAGAAPVHSRVICFN